MDLILFELEFRMDIDLILSELEFRMDMDLILSELELSYSGTTKRAIKLVF